MAEVTIGLVAYNGASTLRAALDSLLAQSFDDYRLILSDNASTDATPDICRDYAARHAQIHYVRRPETLPHHLHFAEVLNEATSPYFMWAPADDLWAPGFLAAHHALPVAHPDYVASQSRVLMQAAGFPSRMAQGTRALRETPSRNIVRFIANPADNCRFYGLYRTAALRRAYLPASFLGFDWAISAATLISGRHHEHPDVLMVRDETPAPN